MFRILEKSNRTQSSIKMWEQIRNSIIIDNSDKGHRVIKSIVEAVEVDKENCILIGILDFGDLACA